jgi:hypothetical protein
MKADWKIYILIILGLYVVVNKMALMSAKKEVQTLKTENISLYNENKGMKRQIDVATEEVHSLIQKNDIELKVYRAFRDSCQELIKKNKTETAIQIKNLLRKSNSELLEIARQ